MKRSLRRPRRSPAFELEPLSAKSSGAQAHAAWVHRSKPAHAVLQGATAALCLALRRLF
jgi:hypothetical protein